MFSLVRMRLAQPVFRVAARQMPMRQFHVTARRYATEDAPDLAKMMQSDPQVREMLEKLSKHPPAIAAMQKVGQIVQSKGFEPGKVPSKMEFMKLMMDSEFREAAQTLTTEMEKAGLDMDPEALSKLMRP